MKRVLIISPYFPPSNAADMQRVRMSLPYFTEFGWDAEIVCVADKYSDINKDILLNESLPSTVKVHQVKAFSKRITSKFGLGSIALRALWFYKKEVNYLLKRRQFDLIYFSTTQYPVCILGPYWKKKFRIPYVIDMQDPWHSDYYQDKPKHERPPKYWFAYNFNKYMEPFAMKSVDGIISVSKAYIKTLEDRYSKIKNIPSAVITFGAFQKDFEIADKYKTILKPIIINDRPSYSIVYIGRGGDDMKQSVEMLFNAFNKGLNDLPSIFKRFKIYFIGTSYAPEGEGKASIYPIAVKMGLSDYVFEQTDRVSFYRTLSTLQRSDVLFIPGSDDSQYTASKIYPYLMAKKPLISIFHPESSANKIIKDCEVGISLTLDMNEGIIYDMISTYLISVVNNTIKVKAPLSNTFDKFTAKNMTKLQVDLFNKVVKGVTASND